MINVHYQQQIARQGLERPGLNGNNYRALNDVRVVIDESFNIYKSRARGFEPGNRNKFTGRNLWLPKCRPYGREFFLAYPSCTVCCSSFAFEILVEEICRRKNGL